MDDQNNGDNVVMEKPSPDEEYYDDEEEYFSVLYTEPDQIEEIVPYLYRNNFSDWAFMSTSIEPNVYVYVNKGNDIDHPFFDCSAVFRKDVIPDIVRANY